jgi:hypothetical protein
MCHVKQTIDIGKLHLANEMERQAAVVKGVCVEDTSRDLKASTEMTLKIKTLGLANHQLHIGS